MYKSLKNIFCASALAASLTLSHASLAQDKCNLNNGMLTVEGTAEYVVKPDIARLNFAITKEDQDIKVARDYVENVITSFIKNLKQIDENLDIVADNLQLQEVYDYDRSGSSDKRILRGYLASRNINVSVNNFDLISKITDIALASGINEVQSFNYDLSDIHKEKATNEAIKLAVASAKTKAQTLSSSFEVNLSNACTIELKGANAINPYQPRKLLLASDTISAKNSSFSGIYNVDDIRISATVKVIYALE